MESVISIGVLAVAVPMILAAIGESGRAGEASGAETRAPWIAAAMFEEIRSAGEGKSAFFTAGADGRVTPPAGEVWALGFTRGGALVERISADQYNAGIRDRDEDAVRYFARVHAAPDGQAGATPNQVPAMRVTVEFPATAPANRRRSLDFHAITR